MDISLKKIVYVEDDSDLRFLVKTALEDIGGFSVRVYESGYDSLAEAEQFLPDLILLDVCMPIIDGVSLLLEYRKNPTFLNTPIIFFTAKNSNSDLVLYYSLGVNKVISKPFNPVNLVELLEDFL